ncbi:hypothetical protein [Noviherbaspirillum pedocola]|uniref:Uncharacterized protein n=1 Tax=Noviherbaspirillum pedocola TaxID=2801341 RepID=A0A934W6C0_9BURK|nr:hypothetical protein [Noviherbaspirillum pedocola]MBK4736032.1 hypothetical protein [Noviherbaspirillum pedocola]
MRNNNKPRPQARGGNFAVPDHTFIDARCDFIDMQPLGNFDCGASSMPPWAPDPGCEDVPYQDVPALPAPDHHAALDVAGSPLLEERRPISVVQFQTAPTENDFVTVAMARSIVGNREVCLVSERSFGQHSRYAIHIIGVQDRSKHVTPITERRDDAEVALDLDFAKVAFEETVKREFAASKLSSGKEVPTFIRLL